jgi:hypothetical protein
VWLKIETRLAVLGVQTPMPAVQRFVDRSQDRFVKLVAGKKSNAHIILVQTG